MKLRGSIAKIVEGINPSDIRYSIFISSTYKDSQTLRQHARDAILGEKCIPVDMEHFVATHGKTTPEVIKAYLEPCDAVILIAGSNYGSLAKDGQSYVEFEIFQALKRGIPVICFKKSGDSVDPQQQRFFKKLTDSRCSLMSFQDEQAFIQQVRGAIADFRKDRQASGFVRLSYMAYHFETQQEFHLTVSNFLNLYLTLSAHNP